MQDGFTCTLSPLLLRMELKIETSTSMCPIDLQVIGPAPSRYSQSILELSFAFGWLSAQAYILEKVFRPLK